MTCTVGAGFVSAGAVGALSVAPQAHKLSASVKRRSIAIRFFMMTSYGILE
jgi:hypothetical protein